MEKVKRSENSRKNGEVTQQFEYKRRSGSKCFYNKFSFTRCVGVICEASTSVLSRYLGNSIPTCVCCEASGGDRLSPPPPVPANVTLTIRLGEKLDAKTGAIDRKPYGSVNYRQLSLVTRSGQSLYRLQIPPKPQHNNTKAVRTPPEIGEITVFRYTEIDNAPAPAKLTAGSLYQLWVHTAFNDTSSAFSSSDETLNAVWGLCKHTVKAATAFGVYIDGERERIPYEADGYINQLSHLACDANPEVGRYTVEYLLAHPTWPTEWSFHMPMMAAADYWFTGDITLSANNYEALKKKLLMEKARATDGLLRSVGIVDWPISERDNYNDGVDTRNQIGPEINTVVNAFYYHVLNKMADIAHATNREVDARLFTSKARQIYAAFNTVFFDPTRGIYIDGEGSTHTSLHANMFPLAFDLVPPTRQNAVADFVQSRGMACSVYGAQYLLESLFKSGRDNMIALGSTMTLEAWDRKYKPNLTWNHAWGASPANIISRYVLGVRPLKPGFKKILIAPQPGALTEVRGVVPTVVGPVAVNYQIGVLEVEIPEGTTARVVVPNKNKSITTRQQPQHRYPPQILINGVKATGVLVNGDVVVDDVGPGKSVLDIRPKSVL
ncbi:hypothetical protein TWF481_002555 [Arthrobotrys musiformis]|uniref:alpha-L-rhamnosidase n=1 Tax=Arthrobotrys musiformis TaxID=47236 RepID=A0AAV9VWR6_9PEZI